MLDTSCGAPLLDGVMHLFSHPGTADPPGRSIESQRFKMDVVYVALLQEVFGVNLIACLLSTSSLLCSGELPTEGLVG